MYKINTELLIFFSFLLIPIILIFIIFKLSKYIRFLNLISNTMSEFIKKKILYKPIPLYGPKIFRDIISSLNKVMLELQAYRAFQLNQILDERNISKVLIDSIPDSLLLLDENNNLLHYNQVSAEMLGIKHHDKFTNLIELIGKEHWAEPIKNILLENEKNEFEISVNVPYYYESISIRVPEASTRLKIENKADFEKKIYKIIKKKYTITSVKKYGVLILTKDITLQKEIEQMKEDFFNMITHDLRSPLTAIDGYTKLIYSMISKDEKLESYFNTIFSAIKKQNGMIDDILNYNKLKNKKLSLSLEKIKIEELVKIIISEHINVAKIKKIELSYKISTKKEEIIADNLLLQRILSNIIGNALKFTPSNGKINIEINEDMENFLFSVEDTGPGIPKYKIPLIFEKYGQLEEHKSQGFGLGLAMCKMAVELHQGKIWVESEIGKGSKFIFTIPKNIQQS